MIITSIKKVETEKVFDIEVEDAHHYILENGVITHNSGLGYLASQVLFLSKSKEKDKSGAVVGAIIKCNLRKSRTSIENRRVEVLLDYKTGLDKYYGLLDLAEKFGIFKKVSTKYELPDGTSVFGTEIERNPEKYFTKEILDAIDARCPDEFLYGKTSAMEEKE